jgi:uncharacterized membrane protein YhiD involved in acid resistance
VIDDTRDTAFVIASVAMGLAAGAGFYLVAILTLPFVFVTTWIFRSSRVERKSSETIEIRLSAGNEANDVLQPIFAKHLHMFLLVSVDKNGKGTHSDLAYAIRLKEGASLQNLMQELQNLTCAQKVKLKRRKE